MRPLASTPGVLGSPFRNVAAIVVFMAVVFVAATAAYVAVGWSTTDAAYMVVLTIYSVGYQEVRPVNTGYLRGVTIATIVFGCTGMILLTSALIQMLTALQLRAIFGVDRLQSRIDHLDRHVVVCGYGRIGVMLAHELKAASRDLVVVERDAAKLADAESAGHLCVGGDATDEAALIAAGIRRARVLATVLPDDAANVFITLSARSLNPRIEIIARGEAPTTERKLRHAGADKVVMPTHIGAERIVEMILYADAGGIGGDRAATDETERVLHAIGLDFDSLVVPDKGALTGQPVSEAERRGGGAFFIVQIDRRGGARVVRPDGNTRIEAGDCVGFVARGGGASIRTLFAVPAPPIRMGRTTFKP